MKKQKFKGSLSFKKSIISKLNADSIHGGMIPTGKTDCPCTQTICSPTCDENCETIFNTFCGCNPTDNVATDCCE